MLKMYACGVKIQYFQLKSLKILKIRKVIVPLRIGSNRANIFTATFVTIYIQFYKPQVSLYIETLSL